MPLKDISYLQYGTDLVLTEGDHFSNFGREQNEEHFCEIYLNLDQCFRRKSFFKISGCCIVWRSGTVGAILAEGIIRNISVKLF